MTTIEKFKEFKELLVAVDQLEGDYPPNKLINRKSAFEEQIHQKQLQLGIRPKIKPLDYENENK